MFGVNFALRFRRSSTGSESVSNFLCFHRSW
jgi:hypothetical protein